MVGQQGVGRLRARLAALAVGAVLVVSLAACGSSSSDGDPTTTTASPTETTETTGAEGASESGESTGDVAVKNAPLNNCTSVLSGERPTTPEAREALRRSQQECQQRLRPTTMPPRAR